MGRNYVHLSAEQAAMAQAGFCFYGGASGVWLVEWVPPAYLMLAA
jgi:RNA:NAD 2'-phosphotransferase (TPT1/KptA family)